MEFFPYHSTTADLAEKSNWDGPIGTNNSIPSDSSLDECVHLDRDADVDSFDLTVRRLSDESVPYLQSMSADLAKKSRSDDPRGTNDSIPSDSPLDEWVHLARELEDDAFDIAVRSASDESVSDASDSSTSSDFSVASRVSLARDPKDDALDIAVRRASDESVSDISDSRTSSDSSVASRVSFAGEEFGLEPRNVVTKIHYRPRTSDDEKHQLFYSSQDLISFRKEVIYEKIKDKMREIKSFPENSTAHEEVRQLYLQVGRLCSM